jgi:hypothetical protein
MIPGPGARLGRTSFDEWWAGLTNGPAPQSGLSRNDNNG